MYALFIADIVFLTAPKITGLGIKEFSILFINRQTSDSAIRDIMAIDKIKTKEEALIEIYKKLRPGEPATDDTAASQFYNLFFDICLSKNSTY